jgi:tetratricopeptide (TPR) repeat protein
MKTFAFLAFLATTAFATEPTREELAAALRANPSDMDALYNLGLMDYLTEDFAGAIRHWKALRALNPNDWRVREKLVQAFWGAGDKEAAVAETAELREARKSGTFPELTAKEFFVCDQFQIGEVRAFVLEYYDLKGDRPLAWKFLLKSGHDYLDHRFSVGSYETSTKFARAEGTIGPQDRLYHLDGYWANGSHVTYEFYHNRPDYLDVRKQVQQIIEGKSPQYHP